MLKAFHLFFQRHYELLLSDAICENLRLELQAKVIYHGLKANTGK